MVLNVVAVFIKCNVASFTWISTIHVNTFITPFFSGSSPLSQNWSNKGSQSVSPYHQKLLWERDVWQGFTQAWSGQGCAPVHGLRQECTCKLLQALSKFMKVFLPWWKIKPTQTKLEKIYECWFRWNWCRISVYLFIWISFKLYFLNFW